MTSYLTQNIPQLRDVPREEMQRIVEALHRVHTLSAALTDLDTLLVRIAEESRHVAQAEACSLLLFDSFSNELFFKVALGDSGDQEVLKREIRLKPGQGIAGVAAKNRIVVVVDDAQSDPRFYRDVDSATQFQTRNLLAVPMVDHDNLIGVLELVNKIGTGRFTELDQRVMEMFSSLVATSVTNARLIEAHIKTERLTAIGQAVAGLSHYTKNIITGLNSSTDLIEQGLEKGNLEILKRAWPVFKRSTRRISNFVQDMLSFSKSRAPSYQNCDIRQIIDEALENFSELFTQKKVAVSVLIPENMGNITVDPDGLHRCLLNLFTNAADAVPSDNGTIRVEVQIFPEESLAIQVSDNGPGVDKEHIQQIFDPFFSTKGTRGTGLGLAVTQKIIHEHGGTITVTNPEGSGASFLIVLPAGPQKAKEVWSL